ncbi:hypothetical protein HDU96_010154 [Phlyctochytrium bullatum]|nr:hypothetical protein HDU96_010154 [Phlyctochytrium bullatum]
MPGWATGGARWQPVLNAIIEASPSHEALNYQAPDLRIDTNLTSPPSPAPSTLSFDDTVSTISATTVAFFNMQSITKNSLPLHFNQALMSTRTGDNAAAIEILTETLTRHRPPSPTPSTSTNPLGSNLGRTSSSPKVLDPRLVLLARWLRGIAQAEWGEEAAAVEDFHEAEKLVSRNDFGLSVDMSAFGLEFSLHLFEIKFNAAVCLWRMGLIDASAQELADARPFALVQAHLDAFDEVMASGFDPPGLFTVPEELLFAYPAANDVGWRARSVSAPPVPPPELVVAVGGPAEKLASSAEDGAATRPRKASDAGREAAVAAEEPSSYLVNGLGEVVPPVPRIPSFILQKVRKESNASPPVAAGTIAPSTEGLSSVAAAVLLTTTPAAASASPIAVTSAVTAPPSAGSSIKSPEDAQRELEEALAAAQAYKDEWNYEPGAFSATGGKAQADAEPAQPVTDSAAPEPAPVAKPIPPPRLVSASAMGGLVAVALGGTARASILPKFTRRVSSINAGSKYAANNAAAAGAASKPAGVIGVGGLGPIAESPAAANPALAEFVIPTRPDDTSSIITSAPSTEIFPDLSTTDSKASSPVPASAPVVHAHGHLDYAAPPPVPSLKPSDSSVSLKGSAGGNTGSVSSLSSSTASGGALSGLTVPGVGQMTSSPASASSGASSNMVPLPFLKMNEDGVQMEIRGSLPGGKHRNLPPPLPGSAPGKDAAEAGGVQLVAPVPERSVAGSFLGAGVVFNRSGSLPGGAKRGVPLLQSPPLPATANPAAGAARTNLQPPLMSKQMTTPPTTPSPTKRRADSSAPKLMTPAPTTTPPPLPGFAAPPASSSNPPLPTQRPRATTVDSVNGQAIAQQAGFTGTNLPQPMPAPAPAAGLTQQQRHHLAFQQMMMQQQAQQHAALQALGRSTSGGTTMVPRSGSGPKSPPPASAAGPQPPPPPAAAPAPPAAPVFPSVAAVGHAAFHRPRATTLDSKPLAGMNPTPPAVSVFGTPVNASSAATNAAAAGAPGMMSPLSTGSGSGSPVSLRPRAVTLDQQPGPPGRVGFSPRLAHATVAGGLGGTTSPVSPMTEQRLGRWLAMGGPAMAAGGAPSPVSPSGMSGMPPTTPPASGSSSPGVSIKARSSSLGGTQPPLHPKFLAKQGIGGPAPPQKLVMPSGLGIPALPPGIRKGGSGGGGVPPPVFMPPRMPLPPTPAADGQGGVKGGAGLKDNEKWKRETVTNLLEILDSLGEGQNQFLAYADYLVALDEVLEKDLGDKIKHKSFYTVCSDDDEDEEANAAVTMALGNKPEPEKKLDDEPTVALTRRLTVASSSQSEAEEQPWASIIDAFLSKRFSLVADSEVGVAGESEQPLGARGHVRQDSEASSLPNFDTPAQTIAGSDSSIGRSSLNTNGEMGEVSSNDADGVLAREFLLAFRDSKTGFDRSTMTSGTSRFAKSETVRDSVVSSLEMSSEAGGDSPYAQVVGGGSKATSPSDGGDGLLSPPRDAVLKHSNTVSSDGSFRYLSYLDAKPPALRSNGLLATAIAEQEEEHDGQVAGDDPNPGRRRFVTSYLGSDAADSESTMSFDVFGAYFARDVDSFYDESRPDKRDSFTSFAASSLAWDEAGKRASLRRRSTIAEARPAAARKPKLAPEMGDRWLTTESSPFLGLPGTKEAPPVMAAGPAAANPQERLVWNGPWGEAPTFWNQDVERDGQGQARVPSLGRSQAQGKPKEANITRRIVDFVMKHIERYTTDAAPAHDSNPQPSELPIDADPSVVLLKALAVPDIESFLYVRFESSGSYKRRWCILRDRSLYIMRSPTDLRLVALLKIGRSSEILPDEDAPKHLHGAGTNRYGFKIVSRLPSAENQLPLPSTRPMSVAESVDQELNVIQAFIDASIDEIPPTLPPASPTSPTTGHPTLHIATEHQLTLVNWVGHLARAARGEKRIGPRTLVPVKNAGEPGRIPLTMAPSQQLLGATPQAVAALTALNGGPFGVASPIGSTPLSANAPPSVLSGSTLVGGDGMPGKLVSPNPI